MEEAANEEAGKRGGVSFGVLPMTGVLERGPLPRDPFHPPPLRCGFAVVVLARGNIGVLAPPRPPPRYKEEGTEAGALWPPRRGLKVSFPPRPAAPPPPPSLLRNVLIGREWNANGPMGSLCAEESAAEK